MQLPANIRALILAEQASQDGRFIEGVDLDEYMRKLAEKAEFVVDSSGDRIRGVVAYYCNDDESRRAYISLVLVDPRDRGCGLGSALIRCVLDIAKGRKFATCKLEVAASNEPAYATYRSLGFRFVEAHGPKHVLEAKL